MNSMMRRKRQDMESYMYQPPESESAEAEMGTEEPPAAEAAEALPAEAGAITVLAPDEPAAEDMYTYERMDNGAWMVYPPGVPCEEGKSRIQLDHPATADEYASMEEALEAAGATAKEPTEEAAEGEGGY
jgi:hypothetical protein